LEEFVQEFRTLRLDGWYICPHAAEAGCDCRKPKPGTYTPNNSVFDLVLLYLIGLVGFLMRRFGFPIAPAVVGMILGPMVEQQFRRALAITQGDYSIFFTRPISATLLAIAAVVLLGPPVLRLVRVWRARGGGVGAS